MSHLDTFLPDTVPAALKSCEASACCLDIVRTTATRDFNFGAVAGEIKLYFLGALGPLKGAELDHNLFIAGYERGGAATVAGEHVGAAGLGFFQVTGPSIVTEVAPRLPAFTIELDDGVTYFDVVVRSLDIDSVVAYGQRRGHNKFWFDARGQLAIMAKSGNALAAFVRSHILMGGLVMDKLTICKDSAVMSDSMRVLVTFSLHEHFWPPHVHRVTPMPLGPQSDPLHGVRLEFATGFLKANDLHKCGKVLPGKPYRGAPADAYCSCDAAGSVKAAAIAQTANTKRSNAASAQERIRAKARKTGTDSVSFPGSAAGSSAAGGSRAPPAAHLGGGGGGDR